MKNSSKILVVLTVMIFVGFAAYAFADWGGGYGMGGRGMGYHMGRGSAGNGGPGSGYRNNLSEEDYKKLDDQRQTFYKETESIRRKIYEKELALRSEMAKETPDAQKASALQKELSDAESEFNQKRIDHMLTLKKADPDFDRGFRGMGPGGGRGSMGRGRGGYGPGSCWR